MIRAEQSKPVWPKSADKVWTLIGSRVPQHHSPVPDDLARAFWDKVMIRRGVRRWFASRRIARLRNSFTGKERLGIGQSAAIASPMRNGPLRRYLDLANVKPRTFKFEPIDRMISALRADFGAMFSMIFGGVPELNDSVAAIRRFKQTLNYAGPATCNPRQPDHGQDN